jgi:hypothetical protein
VERRVWILYEVQNDNKSNYRLSTLISFATLQDDRWLEF